MNAENRCPSCGEADPLGTHMHTRAEGLKHRAAAPEADSPKEQSDPMTYPNRSAE